MHALRCRFTLAPIVALVWLAISSCGGDGQDGERQGEGAALEIVAVRPAPPFAGLPVEIEFRAPEGLDWSAWRARFGDGQTGSGSADEPIARHTWEEGALYQVSIEALSGERVVASIETDLDVRAPLDASVSEVRASPANVDAGQQVLVEFTLGNERANPIDAPLPYAVLLERGQEEPTPLGEGIVEAREGSEEVVGAGQERAVSASFSIPADLESGDWRVVVVIDPERTVADLNREDNRAQASGLLRVTNASSSEAALVLSELAIAPERAFPELSAVRRAVRLRNVGGLDLTDLPVRTYLSLGDDELDDQDTLLDETIVPIVVGQGPPVDLAPARFLLAAPIAAPADGVTEAWVIIEAAPPNEEPITLASERPIVITDEPVDGPDLAVDAFEISPRQTFIDGPLSYQTTLVNEGTADLGSFSCRVYFATSPVPNAARDQPLGSINIPRLAAGERVEPSGTLSVPGIFSAGTYFAYLLCDPNNALGEAFRSNNLRYADGEVRVTDSSDVDIRVERVEVPSAAAEGEAISVEVEVCLGGTNASGPFLLELRRGAGAQPSPGAEPIASAEVDSLDPGECRTITFDQIASCDGFRDVYFYQALADAARVVAETDETNNRALSARATFTGPFCACVEDAFEPNDIALSAAPLPLGRSEAALCQFTGCDFYRIEDVEEGDAVRAIVELESARGALEATLYDARGVVPFDTDESGGDRLEVERLIAQAGDYVLEICSASGARNLYAITVERTPRPAGVDLIARDVDLFFTSPVSVGARAPIRVRAINQGDTASGPLDAVARLSPDATVDASDPIIGSINVASIPPSSERIVEFSVALPVQAAPGSYLIGVRLEPGASSDVDASNNLALSDRFDLARDCYDPLEPNDDQASAYDISSTSQFSNLIACAQAPDFYRICAGDQKSISVTVSSDPAAGDVDLALFEAVPGAMSPTRIAESATQSATETVSVDYVNGARCYLARVYLAATPGALPPPLSYDLDVSIQDVPAALQCTGYAEPNDAASQATDLRAAASQPASIDLCPETDADLYAIDLGALDAPITIELTKVPATQPGVLRIQLFNPLGTPLLWRETAPDLPTATIADYAAPTSGRYIVAVTGNGAQRNITYTLSVTGSAFVDIAAESLAIGPGTYLPGEVVRVSATLRNAGINTTAAPVPYQIFLGALPTPAPGDIALSAGGYTTGSAIAGGASVSILERPVLPSPIPAGTYYLHLIANDLSDANAANDAASVPITIVNP